MKISEVQLLQLVQILHDSLPISNHFILTQEHRQKLLIMIMNQQSTELKDVTSECDHDWVQAISQAPGKPEVTIYRICKEFVDD